MEKIYEKLGLFYLGKKSDDDSYMLYKSKDLTTHAAIIGMTGSGKTGLGIDIIEEALIDNIPAIVIDPKGDMGDLCLAFEDLEPKDFEPWIDSNEALAKGMNKKELAKKVATTWEKGIKSFDQDKQRVKEFAKVKKVIYTPGSSAGVPVNILGSFKAPSKEIIEDQDTFSSTINTTVSSLLSLIDIDSDPLTSKEHILISNILNFFWQQEEDLDIEKLIALIIQPPFKKVGILQLKSFYPQKERMKLAMKLNNIISSVKFSTWISGEPLDIQNMLYDDNAKAKISIFSISHLNDNERMFFVTLLLNAFIGWMRQQRGSSTLRTLLYMDEIFGFFPPTKNPPSKEPMMLLLKQARAFGVGVVLSTQNPVDIDYKGLSNIGSWFIGKLQTDQDIKKVLDPLASKSDKSKDEIKKLVASLKPRHFLLKNIHEDSMVEFYTRWVLSYLKGPLKKEDIKKLMEDYKKDTYLENKDEKILPQKKSSAISSSKPIVSSDIKEYFCDTNINAQTPFYPLVYALANVTIYDAKRGIDINNKLSLKLELNEDTKEICWDQAYEEELFRQTPYNPKATYAKLPPLVSEQKSLKNFSISLADYLYRNKKIEIFYQKDLKLESSLNQSKKDFIITIQNELRDRKEQQLQKLKQKYEKNYTRLQNRIEKAQIKVEKEKSDVTSKTTETFIDIGLTIFSALFGRKKISRTTISRGASSIKKGREIFNEKDDVLRAEALLKSTQEEVEELEKDFKEEVEKLEQSFSVDNYPISIKLIKPRRRDISINDIALLWER